MAAAIEKRGEGQGHSRWRGYRDGLKNWSPGLVSFVPAAAYHHTIALKTVKVEVQQKCSVTCFWLANDRQNQTRKDEKVNLAIR